MQRNIALFLRFAYHYEGHTLTDSDHDIITIKLYLPDIFLVVFKHTQPTTPHNNNFQDLSIKIEDITTDHWAQFEAHILDSVYCFKLLINSLNSTLVLLESNSSRVSDTIDKIWADIKDLLMSAAAHTLPLKKKQTLHPRLDTNKRKSPDLKWLNRHTSIILVFIHEVLQYQASSIHHDLAAIVSDLKARWDSWILSFNKDYADNQELQFDSTFLPESLE
ncbi:hypothetical protein RclHR1_10800008 [Rhizophagus clarus]|uniref:Uncharacterized protein n=1 Tax=Rhizophagus clarus TaxID=94130 RepID=A0A2Z6QHA7_9GLOM|nr:hypothetical protein RclHR1_10800008 [Rhizophagus clarus]